jgi:hypothetical protein
LKQFGKSSIPGSLPALAFIGETKSRFTTLDSFKETWSFFEVPQPSFPRLDCPGLLEEIRQTIEFQWGKPVTDWSHTVI